MWMDVRKGVYFTLICVHMIIIGRRSKTLATRMGFSKRRDRRYYNNCHERHQSEELIELCCILQAAMKALGPDFCLPEPFLR